MSTTNDDKITTAARAVRLELAEELAELATMRAPTSTPGVALSQQGDPVLLVTMTPELGAAVAALLRQRRQSDGGRGRHLLALRSWIEGSAAVLEWRATHAIEIREVRCADPCSISKIEIVNPDGSTLGRVWITAPVPMPRFHVLAGETIKITVANPLDHIAAGVVDLFYEPIP